MLPQPQGPQQGLRNRGYNRWDSTGGTQQGGQKGLQPQPQGLNRRDSTGADATGVTSTEGTRQSCLDRRQLRAHNVCLCFFCVPEMTDTGR